LQDITREIGHTLSFLPLSALDVSFLLDKKIDKLCKDMQNVEFKEAVAEEEIVDKIEFWIRESHTDSVYAYKLLCRLPK